MPRGGQGHQAELSDPNLVALGGRLVREPVATLGWDDQLGTGGRAELLGS